MSKGFGKRLPILEVVWADCQFVIGSGGWESHEWVMSQRKKVLQRSVGYVLADDKKGVVLTESLSQSGNVYGTVVILAAQIRSRKTLR